MDASDDWQSQSSPLDTASLPLALHPVFGQGCTIHTYRPGSCPLVRTAWTLLFVSRPHHDLGCASGFSCSEWTLSIHTLETLLSLLQYLHLYLCEAGLFLSLFLFG